MKRALLALATLALVSLAAAQASKGVRLLSNLQLSAFQGPPTIGSAILSYTSPSGREYAIIGMSNGKHFVDITDPVNPVVVGFVPTPNESAWQEMAVKNQYCYGVSEHNKLAIIDLRNIDNGQVRFVGEWSTTITGTDGVTQFTYGRSHTAQASIMHNVIFLNGSSGFDRRYFIDLNVDNPEAPYIQSYVRYFDTNLNIGGDVLYVHDCTITTYSSGPYAGKEIAFLCCGPDGLWIADVTDKNNTVLMSHLQYLSTGTYCHSGSLSADKKYFYVNDEFDEAQGTEPSNSTHMFNVEDLANPVYLGVKNHGIQIVDHNSIVQNNHLLVSSYRGGLRIYKWNTPTDPVEVGYYDTYPAPDATDYEGNWGVDGRFASGNVILSDRQTGLYVVDPTELLGLGAPPVSQLIPASAIQGGSVYLTRSADDKYFVIKGGDVDLTFQTDMMPNPLMDLRVEVASGMVSDTNLMLFIKNQQTGQWDRKWKDFVGATDQVLTFNGLSTTQYVNASTNRIELRFRLASKKPTFPGSARLRIDSINAVLR